MPDDRVTIDPEFSSSSSAAGVYGERSYRWIGFAALVVVAAALSWLLRSPESGAPVAVGDAPASPPSPEPASVIPAPQRHRVGGMPLTDVVPGFADTLTTLTWRNDGVDVLRWRASQPVPETMLSLDHEGGWNRDVDESGRWWVEIRRDEALTVHAVGDGTAWAASPLQLDAMRGAWSAAWHDTRPGRLAWLACPGRAAGSFSTLYSIDVISETAELRALPLVDFTCQDRTVSLARWGDWGALLHTTDESGSGQALLDPGGTHVAMGRVGPEGEWFVGVGPDGATVWTEGLGRSQSSSFLLPADGAERRPVPGLADRDRLESAQASPDGSKLALVPDLVANFGSEVRIVDADSGVTLAQIAEPESWVARIVWSTDSRFLIYERWPDVKLNWAGVPRDVELVFFDTEAESAVAVSLPGYAPILRSAG